MRDKIMMLGTAVRPIGQIRTMIFVIVAILCGSAMADQRVGFGLNVGMPRGVMDWTAGVDAFATVSASKTTFLDLRLSANRSEGAVRSNGKFTTKALSCLFLTRRSLLDFSGSSSLYGSIGIGIHKLFSKASEESTLPNNDVTVWSLKTHGILGIETKISRYWRGGIEVRLTAPSNLVIDLISIRMIYLP